MPFPWHSGSRVAAAWPDYGILSRHGARIAVASEEGCGATFLLEVPVSDRGAEAPPAARTDDMRSAVAAVSRQPRLEGSSGG
jgi:hypothetical protein